MNMLLRTTALACVITLLACCQLNDEDSAPRAPDLGPEQREEGSDPASVAAASGGGTTLGRSPRSRGPRLHAPVVA